MHRDAKYEDLLVEARNGGYMAKLITIKVGSRSLLIESELLALGEALSVKKKYIYELGLKLSKHAILGPFRIWCTRNLSN